jgi:DNA-binding MarR family transcriptional regulator
MAEMMFNDANQDRFHGACAVADLTPPLLKALLSLDPGQAVPMSVLAKGWRCDASWVTGIVDGLEQRGYVQRRVPDTDRRVKVVEITATGEAAKAKALQVLFDPPAAITSLNRKDQVALRDLIRKVRAAESAGTA